MLSLKRCLLLLVCLRLGQIARAEELPQVAPATDAWQAKLNRSRVTHEDLPQIAAA